MDANTNTVAAAEITGGALTGGEAEKGDGAAAAGGAGAAAAGVQAAGQADKGKVVEGGALTGDAAKVAADEKAKADQAAADKANAALEVKFGDLQVNPEFAGKFKSIAKDLKLDSAGAQKVADLYVEAQKSADADLKLQIAQQDKKWVESMKADKELGGAGFNENVMHARKAITKFGTPELSKLIDAVGLTNHPELVRVFARVGKAFKEDSINGTNGSAAAAAKDDAKAKLQRAYPSMFNPDGTPKASGDRKATS